MPESDQLEELKIQLRHELEKSLLIDPEDRQFWLSNLETLPIPTVQNLLKIIQPKNAATDQMIETALAQDTDQEHLKTLQAQVIRIKQKARGLEEKSGRKKEELQGEELLKQLDEQK